MNKLIDPQAASFSKIYEKLQAFVESKGTTSPVFKDFYDTSNGTMLLELLAGFGAFSTFTAASNRRETYMSYAHVRNSLVGIAGSSNRYSVFQGKNDTFEVEITATNAGVFVPHRAIGGYGRYPLTYLGYVDEAGDVIEEPLPLVVGQTNRIIVVPGALKTKEIITTQEQFFLRFNADDMTEEFFMTHNDIILDLSKTFYDMTNEKLITMSNTVGGIDVYNLDKYTNVTFGLGDSVKWHYIERVEVESYNLNSFGVDHNVVQRVRFFESNRVPETIEQIRTRAPIHAELNSLIRARRDMPKMVFEQVSNMIDVNSQSHNAGVVKISYILNDESLMTPTLKEDVVRNLDSQRCLGVAPFFIVDPLAIDQTATLVLDTLDLGKEGKEFFTSVDAEKILRDSIEFKLENKPDLKEIEYLIERLPNVKVARIELNNTDVLSWNHYYTKMEVIIKYAS